MKTLYLDCGMGAAGDMLTAALIELLPDREAFLDKINSLDIPGVRFNMESSVKCGITGTHISVNIFGEEEESCDHHDEHDHEHNHGHHCHSFDHNHDHEHYYEHNHEHEHSHGHDYSNDHGYDYYDHEHCHAHGHDHEDSCEHGHSQDHDHSHSHSHRGIDDIEHIVRDHLPVSQKVKDDVMAVYQLIAEAESKAHGVPVTEIHFHEVGTLDAVADITAVCMLMEQISPEQVIVSPVHVGSGKVKCAHGILPVPAPATAYILRDVPVYGGSVQGELCTPTGAALLKHFATRFGDMPVMKTKAIGYGMGKKDFDAANCVRALLGNTEEEGDFIAELSCNIDDMPAEAVGFAMEQLLSAGALDVYTVPIGMKKSRPGILLSVICRQDKKEKMINLIFKYTTTLGIREQVSKRYTLERSIQTVDTSYGTVRKKNSEGYGVQRQKYEYEDIAAIARREGVSIDDILSNLKEE